MNAGSTRILYLQLPLIDPHNASAAANAPLAGAYLAQALKAGGARAESIFLPQELVSYGCDAEIIRAVAESEPDILAFTAYMWNVERGLSLAGRLKGLLPECRIWFGGPEIQANSPWLGRPEVDLFFMGEGETAFMEAFKAYRNGEYSPRISDGKAADLASMASPYASSIIGPGLGGQALLETMRGCLGRCRYCYYGKSNPGLRLFPDSSLADFFSWAGRAGLREIYLMDPALDQRPDFPEFLERLAAWNSTPIPLHTELRAESIDSDIAKKLRRAGIRSVEAGLQTVSPEALRIARRSLNRERFAIGARALMDEGIELRTGIIMGLPGDSLRGFEETLAFAAENGISEHAEIYPLALLPGTSFREDAARYGLEYLPVPPYIVTASKGWAEEDFYGAAEAVEDILGKSLYQTIIPRFDAAAGPFARWTGLARFAERRARFPTSLCVLVKEKELRMPSLLDAAARSFKEDNPFGVLQIVIADEGTGPDRGHGPDIDARALALSDRFFDPGHYLERGRLFDLDAQGRFSVRLFYLSRRVDEIKRLMDGDGFCEPIYRIIGGERPDEELLSGWTPLIAGEAVAFERWNDLIEGSYAGREEMKISLPPDIAAAL